MSPSHSIFALLQLLVIFFMLEAPTQAQEQSIANGLKEKSLVSAIFIFGDSTADPGNNNYITTPFKSNFLPYGKDFLNHVPTGRFTNGMLANDFIARYVGVKEYVPPYLDPSLTIEELKTGVSFASAGTGFDPLTPTISNVISLSDQLENFKEYQKKMEAVIGKEQTRSLIKEALFVVSAGTNDFVVNYNTLPIRRKTYTLSAYTDFLLQHVQLFLQELVDQGARKIGVVGLPPMGCLPVVITLHSDNAFTKRDCTDYFSSIARDYNFKLQNQLNAMQLRFANLGSRIAYMDIYEPLVDMILGRKYDFEKANSGCCGTGLLEASFMCNPKSYVCSDASKYVFWDSIHPTEKTYYLIAQALQPTIDSITKN